MKVRIQLISLGAKEDDLGDRLMEIVYHKIKTVLWYYDWVQLMPEDSRVKRVTYRKEMVFSIIEEVED